MCNMKKILFFIDTLGYGGAEKVLVNLVNNMDKTKFDITLMTLFDSGVNKQYLNSDIKYKFIFKKVFNGNVLFLRMFTPRFLYKKFVKDDYDVVIAYLEGNTTRILSGCNDNSVKKIAWLHVEMSEKTLFYPWGSKQKCIRGYGKFDKIVGVSKTVIESFVKNTKKWDNLCVKYNTVDTDYIKDKSKENVDDVIFDSNKLNVISVGRLINQKKYDRLLRIHKRLIDNGVVHNLFILGIGEKKAQLQAYINDNNLNESAHLIGFRDNPWKYVKNSDLFVCSSEKEGFSTAVSESIIVGTPVVTTRCSGMDEMLDDGRYGLIVDNNEDALYEGMYSLLTNKSKLQFYKDKVRERSCFFDKENTVKKVENLIYDLN